MNGFLTLSLDFELFWGVRDVCSIQRYGPRILGYRQAVPALLNLFRKFDVAATWAVVGFAACGTKQQIRTNLPRIRPEYFDANLDPYAYLDRIGEDEASDPYHYGASLVRLIAEAPGMELASHTFSHFYCLDLRRNADAFRADLEASRKVLKPFGYAPISIVFPRNQYDNWHLSEAAAAGFSTFRGNEDHAFYLPRVGADHSLLVRLGRLADSYMNLTGQHSATPQIDFSGMVNVPSSRFLRPFNHRLALLEPLRLARITDEMTRAAMCGSGYHLWWHPHNFGADLQANLMFLERIFDKFQKLRADYGMQSMTMSDAARLHRATE